jgi:death on curing protein
MTAIATDPLENPWESIIPTKAILALYHEVMVRYGGKQSDPIEGCIESCLGNAWNAEKYADAEGLEGGSIFAIHLLIYLARNHCFTDGNKRIAWASFCYVLNYHGLTVRASAIEVEKIMNSLVTKEIGTEGVVIWVRERIVLRGTGD